MLVQSQPYPVPNKTIVMLKEPLEKKMNECQGKLVTEMPAHEQRANDMVHSVFQRSSGNFCESNVLPNTTTTYTKLEHSL